MNKKEIITEEEINEERIRANILRKERFRQIRQLNKISKKHYLMTTRFTNKSHNEMISYCNKIKGVNCIYGVPKEISNTIPKEAILFVLEMNNETNCIEGVGMVKNNAFPNKYGVYEDGNYNRFSYLGKARIDRSIMTEEEESIMQAFDIICFKGSRHLKRSHGITIFPPDILDKCREKMDLTEYIINMFKKRINK